MSSLIEKVKWKFNDNGLKLTNQRRITTEVMINNQNRHLKAEEIYELVKEQYPNIGLATVYRTLQHLNKMRIVSKVNIGDGCSYYEINTFEGQHHHLICKNCGKIIEFKINSTNLSKEVEKMDINFLIQEEMLIFRGLCYDCHQKK